jgi:hypothetical protein
MDGQRSIEEIVAEINNREVAVIASFPLVRNEANSLSAYSGEVGH